MDFTTWDIYPAFVAAILTDTIAWAGAQKAGQTQDQFAALQVLKYMASRVQQANQQVAAEIAQKQVDTSVAATQDMIAPVSVSIKPITPLPPTPVSIGA